MDEEDTFEEAGTGTPLFCIAEAFEDLSVSLKSSDSDEYSLGLKPFCDACSLVSVLFGCLGIAFKFAEMEYCAKGFRGLYGGFYPAVLGSTVTWSLYFFFYSKAKQRYSRNREELSPGLHLASAAEAGALVCLCTNPIWLVKTRMQLQTPQHLTQPYTGFYKKMKERNLRSMYLPSTLYYKPTDLANPSSRAVFFALYALRTIVKEEGCRSLYKGLVPGLFLVTHAAIQFTAYEELRKVVVDYRFQDNGADSSISNDTLSSFDYATLGASSKLAAILTTYPFQVIRSRLQQRPHINGMPKYMDSWHVVKETARFEGLQV